MKELDHYQDEQSDFRLTEQIKSKQEKMLAFMYNVQYQIAAEKFDQKFQPYSELKIIQKNESIKAEQVGRILAVLSEKLHQRILRESIECDRSLNKLQLLWQTMKIQPFHRYYVEKYLHSTYVNHLPSLIKNQDLLIRKQQHIYFSILRAIWAREACLNHISRQLKKYNPENMYDHFHTVKQRQVQRSRKIQQKQYRVHGYRALYRLDQQETNLAKTNIEQLFEDINNYRKLTVHVLDLIQSWKQYICSLTHDLKKRKERIQYYYQHKNYLLTILNDSNFIANTFLSNFFTFSARNDPFLLRPILNLEKKMRQSQQLSFEQLQLYQLIQIKNNQTIKIMSSMQQLYNELEGNIRNRKIFHSNVLSKVKSMSLQPRKAMPNPEEATNKKVKLEPIKMQKLTTLDNNSLRDKQNSQKTLAKSNVIIRKPSELSKPTSTFYGRLPISQNSNPFQMVESDKLASIKLEIFSKVKQDLEYQTKKSLLKSKEFQELIDMQVKKNMNQILQAQRLQLKQAPLQITPISFKQQQIGSYLAYIYKLIPVTNLQLQIPPNQLTSIISEQCYCYFLKISSGSNQVCHIIGRVNRQIKGYKSIEILLVAFKQTYMLERIILRVVEFIWKYQNAKQVVFQFSYMEEQNAKLIKELKEAMALYCTIIEKKTKKITTVKFIFVKKAINQNYVYNPYPQQLHFKLYATLTSDQLKLDTFRQSQQSHLYYEYLLMEMLKRFTNSQDFMVLRDTFKPKNRFRCLLALLTDLQNQKKDKIKLTSLSAGTVSDLNEQLTFSKKPNLQLSDLTTINNIKILMLQLTITPAYTMNVLSSLKGQKFHRYHIHNTVECFRDEQQTEFFILDTQESHYLKILVFKANNYLRKETKALYSYLSTILQKRKAEKRFIQNLWLQMVRHPVNPTQQDSLYLRTFATDEFSSIKKHLYISDYCDWYTDIQIQNGLSFSFGKDDIQIARPMGLAVITSSGSILYCRIME